MKNGLQALVLGGLVTVASIPGVSKYLTSKASADDVTTTTLISVPYTDINPKNNVRDEWEIANPSKVPDNGTVISDVMNVQNLTTGTVENALSPKFIGPLGRRIAYIETNPDFSNGEIYVKNIFDLTIPRTELVSGLGAKLRRVASDSLGERVYFNAVDGTTGKDTIYKVGTTTGNVTRAIPTLANPLTYDVRNPSICSALSLNREQRKFELTTPFFAVAETDNPTSMTGQVYLFNFQTSGNVGAWDGSTPVKVTNSNKKMIMPIVSPDGDKLMVAEVNSEGKTEIWVCNGLQDIRAGITLPYSSTVDLRKSAISFYANGVSFPGAFNRRGTIATFTQDRSTYSGTYNFNSPLNFVGSDFDLTAGTLGIFGSPGQFNMSEKTVMPLPGNDMFPDIKGRRVAFANDSSGKFNICVASTFTGTPIVNTISPTVLNGLTDIGGLVINGNRAIDQIMINESSADTPFFRISSPLKPVSDATQTGSGITGIMDFRPSMLSVRGDGPTSSTAGVYMEAPWNIEDLLTADETQVLDENTITLSIKSGDTYIDLPEDQILQRDLVNRRIRFFARHFSNYGFKAEILPSLPTPPASTAVDNSVWSLY